MVLTKELIFLNKPPRRFAVPRKRYAAMMHGSGSQRWNRRNLRFCQVARPARTRSGAGFAVPLWHEHIADQINQVSTQEAVAMTRRLAREEGILAGTSNGCNVVTALRLAEQLAPNATVVTVMCDTGMKYLSKL